MWHVNSAVAIGVLVCAFATDATAQPDAFFQRLAELSVALEGTYGDEGPAIQQALDRMSQALAEWDRSIDALATRVGSAGAATRTVDMRLSLARMYAQRGRTDEALRELNAIPAGTARADVQLLRALVLDASDKPGEAAEAFRVASTLDASDPIKAYYVLRHATSIGTTVDVQAARNTVNATYRRLLTEAARPKTPPFPTLRIAEPSISDTVLLPFAAYARAYARIAHCEYDEAIAEFRKAAAIDPLVTDPAARTTSMTQAAAALRQGRLSEARALLEGSTALQDSSEAHRVLGLTYWANSQDDKAIEQLEIAIRVNPRDERSRLALARVLSSAGRDVDTERTLQETIHVFPDSAQARWWLGSGYERANRFADARREFELAAPSAVAGRSQFFAKIAQLATSAAGLPGAVEAFARSVSANLNDPESHKRLAGAFLQQDRADDAFVELVVALLIDPRDAGAHAGIGQIHLNAGRYDVAVTALRRAVELSANYAEARYALATALMRLGNTKEAAREFERVEQSQRQMLAERRRNISLEVLNEEASLRAAEGKYDAAIALYEKALTLGADCAVYRQLAELYMKVGRMDEAARAGAMYNRALQGHPASQGTPR